MIKLGIIACSNGMGHISRSIKLANFLSKQYSVYLITDKKKFEIINNNKKIKIIDTKNILNINLTEKKYNQNWWYKIKKKILKNNIKILISDNLPEVVNFGLKCLIISNFFWHNLFNLKNRKIKSTISKIKANQIQIYRNVIFKTKNSKIKYFGFIGSPKKNNLNKKNLLISFGSDDKIDKKLSIQICNFIKKNSKNYKIFLEKKYFENFKNVYKKNKNIFIADFSDYMFSKIGIAIIKPGFGTIQKCFENKIYPITFTEQLNKEFKNNARKLKQYNLGYSLNKFSDCLKILETKEKFKINFPKIMYHGENKIINDLNKLSNNQKI